MRSLVLFALLVGCASPAEDRASGFAGTYRARESRLLDGRCEGDDVPVALSGSEAFFRLEDDEIAGTPIVAYYACAAPDRCDDIYDLARSVSDGPEGWALFIAVAGGTPCKLSYRRRALERVDATTVRYVTTLHAETDAALVGAACTADEAKRRARAMPCVERKTLVAERL